MKNKVENVLSFNDFDNNVKNEKQVKTKRTDVAKDVLEENFNNVKKFEYYDVEEIQDEEIQDEDDDQVIKELINGIIEARLENDEDVSVEELKKLSYEELLDIYNEYYDEYYDLDENVKKFESFKLKEVSVKKEKQPEYTILGEEKEIKSNPLFGVGAVKDQENKKIAFFNNFVVDPPTPRERPIGGYVGQYIDNDKVRGHINRIEGNKVFVESLDEPMKIVELRLKDAVKVKKEK